MSPKEQEIAALCPEILYEVCGFTTQPMTIFVTQSFDAVMDLINHPEQTFFPNAMLYVAVAEKEVRP